MSSALQTVRLSEYPRWPASAAMSPFRYPGGKGFMTGFLAKAVARLPMVERHFIEPFAGGAGAALNLLEQGLIAQVHLNDLDIRIYSAWRAMLEENERFLDELAHCDVSLDTWRSSQEKVTQPHDAYSFELGFATYFINRTSRAGIIQGSGPIGGYKQAGKWRIDARFYRETMLRRVRWLGENRERISINNLTAEKFLRKCVSEIEMDNALCFVDPPYLKAGSRLYLDGMQGNGHAELAEFINSEELKYWVMTYDNHPTIHLLYKKNNIRLLEVNYSLAASRKENEILIVSSALS